MSMHEKTHLLPLSAPFWKHMLLILAAVMDVHAGYFFFDGFARAKSLRRRELGKRSTPWKLSLVQRPASPVGREM
jgi:hypothetical protein